MSSSSFAASVGCRTFRADFHSSPIHVSLHRNRYTIDEYRAEPLSLDIVQVHWAPQRSSARSGDTVMLSKCANPSCNTTLQYLREGKVFMVESGSDGHSSDAPFIVDKAKPVR